MRWRRFTWGMCFRLDRVKLLPGKQPLVLVSSSSGFGTVRLLRDIAALLFLLVCLLTCWNTLHPAFTSKPPECLLLFSLVMCCKSSAICLPLLHCDQTTAPPLANFSLQIPCRTSSPRQHPPEHFPTLRVPPQTSPLTISTGNGSGLWRFATLCRNCLETFCIVHLKLNIV